VINRTRVLFLTLVSISLIALSGCHSAPGKYKIRWVSEADSRKTLELTLNNPTVMGRVHLAVLGQRVRGTYVLQEGNTSRQGKVTQLDNAYKLVFDDGKEQTFTRERESGNLKDENGATWKPDNPPTTATLKETTTTLKEW
jgi:hypothetical protein